MRCFDDEFRKNDIDLNIGDTIANEISLNVFL